MDEKLVKCVIVRDFWDDEGTRHVAGTEIDIAVEAALDGIESGALSRVKTDLAEAPAMAPKATAKA